MSENLVVPAQQLVSILILLPVLPGAKVMLGRSWCKLSPPFVTDRSQPVIIKFVCLFVLSSVYDCCECSKDCSQAYIFPSQVIATVCHTHRSQLVIIKLVCFFCFE